MELGMIGLGRMGSNMNGSGWTVFEAVDLGVAAPVITAALMERLRSQDKEYFPTSCWRHCVINSVVTK